VEINQEIVEFLYESNAIEGETSDVALTNAEEAWTYFTIYHRSVFSYPAFMHVHYLLMRNLDTSIAGELREVAVEVGGTAIPFISQRLIKEELNMLASRINRHIEMETGMDIEGDEAMTKKLHVDFEQIHPFADGNGRVGRIIYNAHRLKVGLPLHIIHTGKEQGAYYKWFDGVVI
jgi:fido (protein-threonine AMPylation protein)